MPAIISQPDVQKKLEILSSVELAGKKNESDTGKLFRQISAGIKKRITDRVLFVK